MLFQLCLRHGLVFPPTKYQTYQHSVLNTQNATAHFRFYALLSALLAVQLCMITNQSFSNLSLFSTWNAVFLCLLLFENISFWKGGEGEEEAMEMTGTELKWPSSKNVTKKAHSALLLMEIRLLTSSSLEIFSNLKEREKGQKTADKRTQTRRLHFSLEDVKISVLKKIKGSTLNAERCLKCRHCSVLEERT